MDVRRRVDFSTKWLRRAWDHRNVGFSNGFEDTQGVVGRLREARIAMDRTDTENLQRWVVCGKEQSASVLSQK